MQTIGFTTEYYTLWEVGEPYEEPIYYGTLQTGVRLKQDCNYVKNLSKDFEKAKAKLSGKYKINLDLRGHSSFTRTISEKYTLPDDVFGFGQLIGANIMDCDKEFFLFRAMREESSARRRVYARRRLIELGLLIRYTWYDTEWYNANWGKRDENGHCLPDLQTERKIRYNYATPHQKALEEKNIKQREIDKVLCQHYFTHGEKIELEIMRVDGFSFQGNYGTTYIETYLTSCGKMVQYKGGSPPDVSDTEFTKVKATVKHDEYREKKSTKLQRIKIYTS